MQDREIDYECDGQLFSGRLYTDPTVPPAGGDGAGRPAVAVCHAWAGRDDFACASAARLAQLGYAGFAMDVYGKGVRGGSVAENQALMSPLVEDRARLRRRLQAGLDALSAQSPVDAGRMAAIGYCFGGLCVLDLARMGAPLRAVVSFHGLLIPAPGLENAAIEASVLVLHGHDDPMVPPEQVLAFEGEMSAAGADWQLHAHGGALHAFTHPDARDPASGALYDEKADRRSWQAMRNFLDERLG
jgi:dienelactone hydrolase